MSCVLTPLSTSIRTVDRKQPHRYTVNYSYVSELQLRHLSSEKKSQEEETCSEARPPSHYIFHKTLHYSKIKSISLQVVILSYTKQKKIIHEPNQNCCVCANTSDGATVLKIDRKDVEVWNVFFVLFCFCCFKSPLQSRERLTAVCRLRRQSPHYHQDVMRQIALGALTASQRAAERDNMGGVEGVWGREWGIQRWLDSLQSLWETDKKHSISWCGEDMMAPAERQQGKLAWGIGQKCYHFTSGDMQKTSIIRVESLFPLSGTHLFGVNKQV